MSAFHTCQRMRKLFLMCQTTGPAEAGFLADPLGFWQTHRRCSFAHAFPFSVLRSSLLVWDWQLVFIWVGTLDIPDRPHVSQKHTL